MILNTPSYEFMLAHFRARRGLHILGAGASVGAAPLGPKFWKASPLDYLRNFGSFPVIIPAHSLLIQRMVDASRGLTMSEIHPEREIRPGGEEPLYWEILQRIPDYYARLHLKHLLSKARFEERQCDSYQVFEHFHPSLISNYNHDGLAVDYCSRRHHVVDMHGTIDRRYGSPRTARLVAEVREFDLPETPDGLIMGISESSADAALQRHLKGRLRAVARFDPHVIAIIGYSFAQNGDDFDDRVSLDCFRHARRGFRGKIYVVQPEPYPLREMIADSIKSKNVVGVRARWNVLAHAFMKNLRGESGRKSLNYVYEQILDKYGCELAFPIPD